MKKLSRILLLLTSLSGFQVLLAAPAPSAAAQTHSFFGDLFDGLVTPLIGLVSMLALVYFLFGIVRFFADMDQSEESRSKLKRHMIWGLLGLFMIFSIGGIMSLISSFISFK